PTTAVYSLGECGVIEAEANESNNLVCVRASRGRSSGRSEVKRLVVGFDGIARCFPALQPALKKLNPQEILGSSAVQNLLAGLAAGAGAINDGVDLSRDQRRILHHFFRRNPFCAGNEF